jgi:Fic family protein
MRGVRGGTKSPGEFRSRQNWIGRPGSHIRDAIYVPPPPSALAACLESWVRFLADRSLPPLIQLAMLHYQFEAIHPFRDGNGRVGRLLITLFLLERQLLPSPLLYLSAFFEATRQDYYRRLLAVSTEGDWEEWIIYFLNGVAHQSEDAADRAARINALVTEWRRLVSASGSRSDLPIRLVDRLAGNPYTTARGLARRERVAFTTAQRAIARLERLGVLRQVNDAARDRLYCATALLDILEEPARLVPEPD